MERIAVVDAASEDIAAAPSSYPLWRSDRPYRKEVRERFPYIVFFLFDAGDDAAIVVAVAHARRRPGYGVGRTP